MEAELKCRNTASSASGLSFARCWLRAEAVGMEESSPQKSSISTLVEDEPCETRKEISFWVGIFLLLLKSESGWTAYCEISETMCSTEEKKQFFDLLMDHDHVPP